VTNRENEYELVCETLCVPPSEGWGIDDLFISGEVVRVWNGGFMATLDSKAVRVRYGRRMIVLGCVGWWGGTYAVIKYLVLDDAGTVLLACSNVLARDPSGLIDHAWGRRNRCARLTFR
jgi:hypothetical protein